MALVDPRTRPSSPAERARGQAAVPTESVEPLLEALAARHPDDDLDLVRRAHELATKAHAGQTRLSGEPYVTHSIAVAMTVAELGLDATSAAAALLHDVVEDTEVTLEEVETAFGPTVAAVVDGVTKLDRLHFSSKEAQQAATVRKMLVAMAKDWRVLVIKLADRLHNMRTLGAQPEWKQRRTAQQTLDIYAPLAHRLGIQEVKWQLEDLSFQALHPKRYGEIAQMVATRAPRRDAEIAQVVEVLKGRLAALGIDATVTGRPKHLWSIYEKMVVRGKEFDEIYDLVGIRIIVTAEKDCWAALGSVHALWPPVPGRFKDYVNSPKFNLYQSLHTTVVGPQGKPLEIQIRTQEMHRRAEYGIAAHWGYKEEASHPATAARTSEDIAWMQRIADFDRDVPDPIEFLEALKLDLEQDEVYVFTPKGQIVTLPANATPVDFAYAIHTEVGHHCIGARVNGRLSPLDAKLASGDTVEVVTSKVATAGPSRDWLQYVVSPRARNKIRQWFSRERREDAIETGREELLRALRREGLPAQRLAASASVLEVATELGFADLDALHAAIGEGHCSPRTVVQRLQRDLDGGEVQLPTTALPTRRPTGRRGGPGVYVEGLDDLMVRLSRCCTPVPGDPIIGFVTRGRGVSVHRADCVNAITLSGEDRERLIEVEWDEHRSGMFVAGVEVKALDRSQLLADVARVLAEHHVGIIASSSQASPDRVARMRFECELADVGHLDSVLTSIRGLEGVYDAYRLLPGSTSHPPRAAHRAN
ncbi:MAG: bifunctional (p)ppGpp synthetase/guanosine-3',5'-bis(diphosphate) 3'-pyrophosphohydrolase [Actinomycetota bacterium]|nr:bifunctional (p)ppGpp synthetase/guanosine-3',5'-bis(diphosphate) 3'-pyrophosphohydrolase [Actinomycetota bacterium]MDA8284088.1 bifunctional (p)ppGpp synthetase/guanosine-3',5'-bis(diphosphate) 3'-pyrophosphohydrolase [Actinomycetota bacterium]